MNMDASSTETASSTPENSVGLDFLHVRINQDNASGRFGRKVTPGSPLSRTAICTSATPNPSASTSGLRRRLCKTIPIR